MFQFLREKIYKPNRSFDNYDWTQKRVNNLDLLILHNYSKLDSVYEPNTRMLIISKSLIPKSISST